MSRNFKNDSTDPLSKFGPKGWVKKVNAFHESNLEHYKKAKRYFREDDFYDDFGEPTDESCIALWEAVLYYAFHESFVRADKEIFKRRSRVWIGENGEDFVAVCNMIGFEPDYVYEQFMKKIKNRKKIY